MLQISKPTQVLVIGATELVIPKLMSLKEGVRHYSQQYPLLRQTTVYEEDGVLDETTNTSRFTIHTPPPKVNG